MGPRSATGIALALAVALLARTAGPAHARPDLPAVAAPDPLVGEEAIAVEELAPEVAERAVAAPGEGSPEQPDPFEWAVVPLAGYNSDIGFAGMILGMFYWYDEEHEPYRSHLRLVSSLTTERVTFQQASWERVGLFGSPLRLRLGAGFIATKVSNYCGLGNEVSCARAVAEQAARASGLVSGEPGYGRFVRQYYLFRAMRPEASLALAWEPTFPGLSLVMDVRYQWNLSGFFGARGPFEGSLYAHDYPDGEEGLMGQLQVGVVYDTRNHERRATRGYVVGIHARASHVFLGSDWRYAGWTFSSGGHATLDRAGRLVWANRLVADLLFGEPPTHVLGAVGGLWPELAYGGQFFGRGIRARRYIGGVKVIGQSELRWAFWGEPGEVELLLLGWVDSGWVGVQLDGWGGNRGALLTGFGGGAGAHWGQNFVLRFDVGLSEQERFRPQFYLSLTHPY